MKSHLNLAWWSRSRNTIWLNKSTHIKRETQDEVDDETFKGIYGDNNLKPKRGAFVLEIRDPREQDLTQDNEIFCGFLIWGD